MYFLGVDGGGTKTRYVLINEEFERLVDIEKGTIHIHQIGVEELKEQIKKSIDEICKKVNIRINELTYIFLAVPGYGESIEDKKIIDKVIEEILIEVPYTVDNDSVAGWAAGTGCKEGINIVSGTGSIAFGKNKLGKSARVGGWGPIIGDDGSAHAIALKVINEYTKQKDGRKPRTQLVEVLEREMKINCYYGIVDLIFNEYKQSRTEIAKFSKIGSLAANEGCTACKEIFKDAAYELFLHIDTLAKELDFEEEFIVSYTGGVFNTGELVLNPLKEFISASKLNCKIQEPELDPWNGAALMAYLLSGRTIPKNYKFR
ncbi:BadF-type ATPase [Clostridium cavendishii DSM 21758]|uniref:BadF-type ATPase n=1 Tax=Clostridium cavendishii DSM 21758 TaxID=1121302 RepID=A0A1M6DFM5_9CLOT|nr:BadF/BadG/BcrA/BcrD ATPase family protein [Clostridium cavendishii]SHI71982.1 BadF-type ATPase [Clostridium cavendishii DSM 21758]